MVGTIFTLLFTDEELVLGVVDPQTMHNYSKAEARTQASRLPSLLFSYVSLGFLCLPYSDSALLMLLQCMLQFI